MHDSALPESVCFSSLQWFNVRPIIKQVNNAKQEHDHNILDDFESMNGVVDMSTDELCLVLSHLSRKL